MRCVLRVVPTRPHIDSFFALSGQFRHELHINRGSRDANQWLIQRLEEDRVSIETEYGSTLGYEKLGPARRAVRIAEYRDGHIRAEDHHDDHIDWFINRGQRLRHTIETLGLHQLDRAGPRLGSDLTS